MSQFTDFAADVTAKQVEVAKQGQEVFLAAVRSAVDVAPKVPQLDVPTPVKDAFKPVFAFFGTADEVNAYVIEAATTWFNVTRDFSDKVVAELKKAA